MDARTHLAAEKDQLPAFRVGEASAPVAAQPRAQSFHGEPAAEGEHGVSKSGI